MTLLANIFPTGTGGPILNYKTNGWGVHLWQFEANELFVRFVHRNGIFHKPLASRVLQVCSSFMIYIFLKATLRLLDFQNFGWLNGAGFSAHKPDPVGMTLL